MSSILETIAESTRKRVAEAKKRVPAEEMKERALAMDPNTGFPFEKALAADDISFICECKKASPSKGLIAPDFPYVQIAKDYERAGASAISVLTEPEWFMGSTQILQEITSAVHIPVIRKDFTIDEYMIYEAKVLGASAVLLICALLDEDTLRRYREIADSLGLSSLVEAHDDQEIQMAIRAGARIIGVNNRNLKDFTVDVRNARNHRAQVPCDILFVSESGIKTPQDIDILRDANVDAVLIGETLMRAKDKPSMLDYLKGKTRLKICGMRRPQDIEYANQTRPDYIGFIFDPSRKRYIAPENAASLKDELDPGIQAAGVFVNAEIGDIVNIAKAGTIDLIQLHGQESPEYIEKLREALKHADNAVSEDDSDSSGNEANGNEADGTKADGTKAETDASSRRGISDIPIIKAFKITSEADLKAAEESPADLILLDNGAGTGQPFDWTLLSGFKGFRRPFILAGGLGPDNAGAAIRKFHPFAIDASSSLETDSVKDLEKMQALCNAVRNC
ncbi:MAG: indole-3-glycerol phosphate synthase TrpC [Eubacterium sp.]